MIKQNIYSKKVWVWIIGCFILFLFIFKILTRHDNFSYTIDSIPNNYTALSFAYKGGVDFSEFKKNLVAQGLDGIYLENDKSDAGGAFSRSPLAGLLGGPFFYVSNQMYGITYKSPLLQSKDGIYYLHVLGKRHASSLVAVSSVLVFLIFFLIFQSVKMSLFGTFVYSFGTIVYSTAAQGNWQHAASLLFITAGYLFLSLYFRKKLTVFLAMFGIFLGLAGAVRITNSVFFLSPLLLFFLKKQHKKIYFAPVTGFLTILLGWYVLMHIANVPVSYVFEVMRSVKEFNVFNSILASISLFISPNVGLFIFSPIFLLGILGIINFFRTKTNAPTSKNKILRDAVFISIVNVILLLIAVCFWWGWDGAYAYGPRLLVEAMPFFTLLTLSGMQYFKTKAISVFGAVVLSLSFISVLVQFIGVYAWNAEWHMKYDKGGPRLEVAWKTNPSIIPYYLFQQKTLSTLHLIKQEDKLILNKNNYFIDIIGMKLKLIKREDIILDKK